MTKPRGLTRDLGPFKPELKCCTFHPFLPSFTIGALLSSEAPVELRSPSIEKYLTESRLSPLGAFPKKPGTSICETGRDEVTACGFLSNDKLARCTIRDFRPSPCAGYVCRSLDGGPGLARWRKWEAKVQNFEWTLAHLAAFELGRTMDDIHCEFTSLTHAKSYFARAYEVALKIEMFDANQN